MNVGCFSNIEDALVLGDVGLFKQHCYKSGS